MPIVSANEQLQTTKQQGRVVVCNPTRRTLPRSGKNGTASQFSDGTGSLNNPTGRVPTKPGNTFGNNRYATRAAVATDEKRFGQFSNVAIATGRSVAPVYTETAGPHPNAHFFDVARQPKRKPSQPGSPAENGSRPAGVFDNEPNPASNVMPHQRNGIGANQGKNLSKRATFRASAGGAHKTLPSDTPFHKLAVKRQPGVAQTRGVPSPADSTKDNRARVPSFVTRGQVWYDPNNSFAHGATSTATGRTGTGRWNVIKRGAAG